MSDPLDLHHPEGRSDRQTPADGATPATIAETPAVIPTVTAALPFTTRATPADQPADAFGPVRPTSPDPTTDPTGPDQAAARSGTSRQDHYGARNRHNILLVAAVAAASVGLGGFFLISSKSNAITPAAYANQTSRIAGTVPAATTPPARGAAAEDPYPAAVPQARVVFAPPSAYAANSLTADPGCVGYNDATNASSAALGDSPTAAAAAAALAGLGASLQKSAAEAQDPVLASALAAEAQFVLQAQPTLVTALASGDSADEVAAYQPIEDTDTYVSAVCGSDLDGNGSAD